MGFMRIEEHSIGSYLDVLLFAVENGPNTGVIGYNAALEIEEIFKFDISGRAKPGDTMPSYRWERVARVLCNPEANDAGRGRLLNALRVYEKLPPNTKGELQRALWKCLHDSSPTVQFEAVGLALRWKLYRNNLAGVFISALSSPRPLDNTDIDELGADVSECFSKIRFNQAQREAVAWHLPSADFTTFFLAKGCIQTLGTRGRFAEAKVREMLKARRHEPDFESFQEYAQELFAAMGVIETSLVTH